MHDLMEHMTWPAAAVLIAVAFAIAAVIISILGEWPKFGRRG